jgi:hypothetical protein
MTPALQLFTEISVVVNLSVVGNVESSVFIRHWLMAGLYIDDTQTPVAQAYGTINEDAFVVRSTILDDVAHPLEHGGINHAP